MSMTPINSEVSSGHRNSFCSGIWGGLLLLIGLVMLTGCVSKGNFEAMVQVRAKFRDRSLLLASLQPDSAVPAQDQSRD